jgi:hypothetical protein
MMMSMIRRLAAYRLAIGACVSLVPVVAKAQAPVSSLSAGPSLVTSGHGEAKIVPDRASVLVNVQTRATTAAAAASENAQRTKAVLDALTGLGLPREQLSTEGYTVSPEMVFGRDGTTPPRVSGYVVTNSIRAETQRTEQAGAIVDAALGAGANLINSLSFFASSIETPRRQAIAAAVANARADADAMARAAGGSLGQLLELSTQGPTVPPRVMFDIAGARARSTMAMAEPTPINPGQQTVNVYVNARWQFIPGTH